MQIDTRELEGRAHFVVPVVLITEGVHRGSRGPVFYPADELRSSVPYWNGKPVVVYHPDMLLSDGYAGNPVVFNRQKVGTLFNARFESGALKAEAWIDVERVGHVDRRVASAIQNRRMVEVSTGLGAFASKSEAGAFNGKSYAIVARYLQPDHLAILPDLVGACSIADGAGLCRNETLLTPALAF